MQNFSPEYLTYMQSPSWHQKRRFCMALTLGRDCLFPWLRATDVDHLHYRHLGHELPFVDIVPLNRSTHKVVTWAREVVGREPVNIVLQIAFALWLLPYAAAFSALVLWFNPSFVPAVAHVARDIVQQLFQLI